MTYISVVAKRIYTVLFVGREMRVLPPRTASAMLPSTAVVTLDRQLQNAVLGMEHKAGLVKVMDDKCTAKDLAEALNSNTKIIVTTIHNTAAKNKAELVI